MSKLGHIDVDTMSFEEFVAMRKTAIANYREAEADLRQIDAALMQIASRHFHQFQQAVEAANRRLVDYLKSHLSREAAQEIVELQQARS